ncbi:MAG: hypothetical protein HC829_06820 [Bacteroidales bacterium]|nr:hypothetical protein [Bacteroidales bacterium]
MQRLRERLAWRAAIAWGDTPSVQRHRAIADRIAETAGRRRWLLLGDSNAAAAAFGEACGAVPVVAAFDGATVETFLFADRGAGYASRCHPLVIVVALGANDAASGSEVFAKRLQRLRVRLRRWPVCFAAVPCGALAEVLPGLAHALNVPLITTGTYPSHDGKHVASEHRAAWARDIEAGVAGLVAFKADAQTLNTAIA